MAKATDLSLPKLKAVGAQKTGQCQHQRPFVSTSSVQVVVDVALSARMGRGRSAVRSVWHVGPRDIGKRIAPLLAIAPKKGQAGAAGRWRRS